MYVTAGEDVNRLTRLLGDSSSEWKAFTVSPGRVIDALNAIHPRVIVFDTHLQDMRALQRQAKGRCCHRTVVTSDADLSRLTRLLGSI